MYPYKESDFVGQGEEGAEDANMEWVKDLPPTHPMQLEAILDSREVKRTRRKVNKEHLVKWLGLQNEYVVWMSNEDIAQHGVLVVDLISSLA